MVLEDQQQGNKYLPLQVPNKRMSRVDLRQTAINFDPADIFQSSDRAVWAFLP